MVIIVQIEQIYLCVFDCVVLYKHWLRHFFGREIFFTQGRTHFLRSMNLLKLRNKTRGFLGDMKMIPCCIFGLQRRLSCFLSGLQVIPRYLSSTFVY